MSCKNPAVDTAKGVEMGPSEAHLSEHPNCKHGCIEDETKHVQMPTVHESEQTRTIRSTASNKWSLRMIVFS